MDLTFMLFLLTPRSHLLIVRRLLCPKMSIGSFRLRSAVPLSQSTRVTVDSFTGNVSPTNYYPFGAYIAQPTDNIEQRFTGKIRDTESGNDYFDARYYSNRTRRFMSPDWSAKEEPVPYATLDYP